MTNTSSDKTSTDSNNTCESSILDEKYKLNKLLGSGHFGEVYEVTEIETQKVFAAKLFKTNSIECNYSFKQEVNFLQKLAESDITTSVRYYSSGIGTITKEGKTELRQFIIMEYGSKGDLLSRIKKSKGFSEDVCKYLLFKIIEDVKDLHKIGVCHRDIKPQNFVFVGEECQLKICDFGLATYLLKENGKKKLLIKGAGTPPYIPPEVIRCKPYDGEKFDVFSIGVTLFTLMYNMIPFQAFTNNLEFKQSLYSLIANRKLDEYWNNIEHHEKMKEKKLSKEFKELFIKMVEYNPKRRISLDEIMNSEWMKDIKNASEEYLEMLRHKMISEI